MKEVNNIVSQGIIDAGAICVGVLLALCVFEFLIRKTHKRKPDSADHSDAQPLNDPSGYESDGSNQTNNGDDNHQHGEQQKNSHK